MTDGTAYLLREHKPDKIGETMAIMSRLMEQEATYDSERI